MRSSGIRSFAALCRACSATAVAAGLAFAQIASTGYQQPSQILADLVDAPLTPSPMVSPDRQWLLLGEQASLPSIADLAEPELRLAGIRFNPKTAARTREPYYRGLSLVRLFDGGTTAITGLPPSPKIRDVHWSPDSSTIAFALALDTHVELWVADAVTGKARRALAAPVSSIFGAGFHWLPSSKSLIVSTVPGNRPAAPARPDVPQGPVIQESLGKAAAARTYQDLLESPFDGDIFEYYAQSQLVQADLSGKSSPIGKPGLYTGVQVSPDGRYLLVESIHRPFSFLVPYSRFPQRTQVWQMDGRVAWTAAELPLAEQVPIDFDAVRDGRRELEWQASAPATVQWVEAKDGGDPKRAAQVRDEVYSFPAPFRGEPRRLASLEFRFSSSYWTPSGPVIVSERWWKTRAVRTWTIATTAGTEPFKLFERSFEDRYSNPGAPVTVQNAAGHPVTLTAPDGSVYFSGLGASSEGDRPFVDRVNLTTGQSDRLWRSEAPYYEYPVEVLGESGRLLLTSRESRSEPPNYFLRNLETGELRVLTHFPDPAPQLQSVVKELVKYKRADGVELSGTLYLPPGYQKGPVPMLMWAYPREFKSAAAAGQVSGSPYRFIRLAPTGPLLFLALGYAVLDDPAMPIVGEGAQEPNDTYVEQLVGSARAAVDEMVRRGVADPKRIAIGGHSYGAFMTANLLAHSDLFAAGIARSGAYNRTLTPFGFQAEERTFWQAPEIYFRMSPFMNAEKINEPILLIHGLADNNAGTFPIQSERMYHALKGLGKTTRLVMLPLESHGYRGRESVLHMLAEMERWLDRYVRKAALADSE